MRRRQRLLTAPAALALASGVRAQDGISPEQFSAFVQSEIQRWGQVVKLSGAKPE